MAHRSVATPMRRGGLATGWSHVPPAQRLVAAILLVWIVAFPCALALLLVPAPAAESAARPSIAKRGGSDADAMEAILQRPLFSRSRRPPAPPMMQAAPMPLPAPMRDRSLVVRGIVIRDGGAKAFVTAATDPQGTWIGVGDAIGGWQVAAIEPRDVRFKGGDEGFVAAMTATGSP